MKSNIFQAYENNERVENIIKQKLKNKLQPKKNNYKVSGVVLKVYGKNRIFVELTYLSTVQNSSASLSYLVEQKGTQLWSSNLATREEIDFFLKEVESVMYEQIEIEIG